MYLKLYHIYGSTQCLIGYIGYIGRSIKYYTVVVSFCVVLLGDFGFCRGR